MPWDFLLLVKKSSNSKGHGCRNLCKVHSFCIRGHLRESTFVSPRVLQCAPPNAVRDFLSKYRSMPRPIVLFPALTLLAENKGNSLTWHARGCVICPFHIFLWLTPPHLHAHQTPVMLDDITYLSCTFHISMSYFSGCFCLALFSVALGLYCIKPFLLSLGHTDNKITFVILSYMLVQPYDWVLANDMWMSTIYRLMKKYLQDLCTCSFAFLTCHH